MSARPYFFCRTLAADDEALLIRQLFERESAAFIAGEKHRPAFGRVEVVVRWPDGSFAVKRDWSSLPWELVGEEEARRCRDDFGRCWSEMGAVVALEAPAPGRAA